MVCECEQALQSKHSPGLVQDDEEIVYCLIDPDLYDRDTSTLKNKAFSKTALRKTDLSVIRKHHSSSDEVQEKVINPQVARKPHRRFCGVLVCQSANIRAINNSTKQDFCVADAGLEGFASHAHLGFCNALASMSKSAQEAARSNLVAAFQTRGIQGLEVIFEE